MGINIGAAASALLSAPLRNLFSFNLAFIVAGVGLLIGVTILSLNWKKLAKTDVRSESAAEDITLTRIFATILAPAAVFGAIGYFIGVNVEFIAGSIGPITFAFIVGMMPVVAYFGILVKNASPEEKPGLSALIPVFIAGGTFFMILHLSGGLMTFFAENNTNREANWIPESAHFYSQSAMPSYFSNASKDLVRPHEESLIKVETDAEAMFGARMMDQAVLDRIVARYPDLVAVEDTDPAFNPRWSRVASKVFAEGVIRVSESKDNHGRRVNSVRAEPESAEALKTVALVRKRGDVSFAVIPVSDQVFASVYKGASDKRLEPAGNLGLVNAEMITALFNPVFVVIFTPLVVFFFAWRIRKKKEISTARKIFLGMVITTVALIIMGIGAYAGGDGASKVSALWLVVFYAVITIGELCLSPMGLSLVTKLSPKRLVGLMMGGWFLSTAIGNKMSGFISGLEPTMMMFLILAALVLSVAGVIFVLLPRLDKAIKQYGA